jgi:mono/diheme cytochrome c family protein
MLRSEVSRRGEIHLESIFWLGVWIALIASLGTIMFEPTRHDKRSADIDRVAIGKQLYTQHCAACHGDQGDGNGPAARFLYPKPRNFGEAKFRLSTTVNSMSTDDDLLRVITRGMSGSAMFPFGHLSEEDRKTLVAYQRELTLRSFMDVAKREAEKAGEKINADDLKRDAMEVLKPGDPVAIPATWPQADAASIARGKESYLKTCAACHGTTGKGDGVQDQRNGDGTPTAPRDFTRGIFKGGREREQLYARIALGMAGTPMPATTDLTPEAMCDLVHFIQSLAPAEAQDKVEHRRTTMLARRSSAPLGQTIPETVWAAAASARIVVSPLWWRAYVEPELTVRALHDGQTIVVRLSWHDETCNDRILKPDDFEDMAAVQLFQGAAEPFLGMGAADAALDLWLWRASWQKPRDFFANQADDYPFDAPFYHERLKALGKPVPDLQTAHAVGNAQARIDPTATAGNLTAKGFGSTTFRPRASQLVSAKANWSNGNWKVEFRRPLAVATNDGLALAPGSRCSIAFALWDGAAHDRNGQKLVSIWHDLRLEQ